MTRRHGLEAKNVLVTGGSHDRLVTVPAHIGEVDQVDALFDAVADRFGR
ncbi:MAG: hypothetical protein QNJ22_06245 [Desulfosarcinaceae bacterium]|nr:hypothetical protein [Desulfosarcinaceae bacterium]